MSGNGKGRVNLDRLVSVLALAAGGIALFYSWQANRVADETNDIASRQSTARLAILSSDYTGGGYWRNKGNEQHRARCRQVMRMSNLGGAATAVVGYDAEIHYKGSDPHPIQPKFYLPFPFNWGPLPPWMSILHSIFYSTAVSAMMR